MRLLMATNHAVKAAAEHLHSLGFNVTTIGKGDKEPAHDWNNKRAPWATERQPLKVVRSLPLNAEEWIHKGRIYQAIEAVGVVNGVGGYRTIDIDPIKRDDEKIPVPDEV